MGASSHLTLQVVLLVELLGYDNDLWHRRHLRLELNPGQCDCFCRASFVSIARRQPVRPPLPAMCTFG